MLVNIDVIFTFFFSLKQLCSKWKWIDEKTLCDKIYFEKDIAKYFVSKVFALIEFDISNKKHRKFERRLNMIENFYNQKRL